MKKYLSIFTVILLIFSLSYTIFADNNVYETVDQNNNLRLGNDYIVIIVNQDENSQGRFAIETTGGAPLRDNDENKPLIYGRPKPWTSYTTLLINEESYVFGGSTERRAGRDAKYGEIITKPTVKNNQLITECLIEDFKVKQILSFVKSSTTGLYDTAEIKYEIKNTSNKTQELGLRIMLDTMLGENDGAPFRIGEEAITTDTLLLKDELTHFWQAFDSIGDPVVTSQGTFVNPQVTIPDKVYLTDWGSLADGAWDFDFNPGQEFVRKGEYEIDSAIALYWESESIAPGETRTYVTNYGLGGITIVPGLISLGLASPAEITFNEDKNHFTVIAYVENTSEITAENVNLELDLPDNFTTDNNEKNIGDMKSGEITQISWEVKPENNEILSQNYNYSVIATSDNTDSNQANRDFKIIGPPIIDFDLKTETIENVNGNLIPNPFTITANIKNIGGSNLYNAIVELELPPGLQLAFTERGNGVEESKIKIIGNLSPGESREISWKVSSLTGVDGELPFVINVSGLNNFSSSKTSKINIPEVIPVVFLETQSSSENQGDYMILDIKGNNLNKIDKIDLSLKYDAEKVKPLRVMPGNLFVKNGKLILWDEALIRDEYIDITQNFPDTTSDSDNINTTIASLLFKVLEEGDSSISWSQSSFENSEGEEIEVIMKN